jgi:hypothetical protein
MWMIVGEAKEQAMYVLWESWPVYAGDTSVWPAFPLLREYREVARGTLIEMMDAHNAQEGSNPDYEYHIRPVGVSPQSVPAIYLSGEE